MPVMRTPNDGRTTGNGRDQPHMDGGKMFEQLMDSFRKTSESSMQMQQEMLTHWAQQWLAAPPNAAGVSAEWGRNLQKRWSELALEMLNKHREALDSSYKSGIQIIEQ